jgi:hypothetical protein
MTRDETPRMNADRKPIRISSAVKSGSVSDGVRLYRYTSGPNSASSASSARIDSDTASTNFPGTCFFSRR